MKEQMKNARLLYVEEHLSCGKYLKEINTGFIFKKVTAGYDKTMEQEAKNNYLVLVLEGSVKVSCNLWKERVISGGEMVLIAKSSIVQGECLKDAQVLILAFDFPTTSCDKMNFQHLAELTADIDYNLDTLPINYPIKLFCELMIIYLEQKANCMHLHEAKHNELLLCLRYFYTKQDLARLFYPMLTSSLAFQHFILENYKRVKSVKELIGLSCMGTSAFYDKFKRAFGVSAKQWLTRKKLERMINKASEPDMTVKKLMTEFDFESLSQFQLYCKKNLGCTSSTLIQKAQTGDIDMEKSWEVF